MIIFLVGCVIDALGNGPAVDMWSLGVCAFEFYTGIPPFNDDTVELVFQHILDRNIPWPPEASEEVDGLCPVARDFIERLLSMEPAARPSSVTIREHDLFQGVPWDSLHSLPAPFVPQPDNELDTGYFEDRSGAPTAELGIVTEEEKGGTPPHCTHVFTFMTLAHVHTTYTLMRIRMSHLTIFLEV